MGLIQAFQVYNSYYRDPWVSILIIDIFNCIAAIPYLLLVLLFVGLYVEIII